ncbi:hypothetical protein V1264_018183 [Littorina saxatilis]|uniref:BZIP domain-containing protein n=1 Tax=Littorina saxatilis TaxID=31220 RepID=A0AAN9BBZ9_9CAEN
MEAEPIVSSSQESLGPLLDFNLPSNEYLLQNGDPDFDEDLADAAKQAKETGSITPVVKHELKCLIQSRRVSQGKPELTVDFLEAPIGELTGAEKQRRLRRKEQNRMAARRFRKNRKLQEDTLHEEATMLEAKNEALVEKIAELNRLKNMLLTHVSGHLVCCPAGRYPYKAAGVKQDPSPSPSPSSLPNLPAASSQTTPSFPSFPSTPKRPRWSATPASASLATATLSSAVDVPHLMTSFPSQTVVSSKSSCFDLNTPSSSAVPITGSSVDAPSLTSLQHDVTMSETSMCPGLLPLSTAGMTTSLDVSRVASICCEVSMSCTPPGENLLGAGSTRATPSSSTSYLDISTSTPASRSNALLLGVAKQGLSSASRLNISTSNLTCTGQNLLPAFLDEDMFSTSASYSGIPTSTSASRGGYRSSLPLCMDQCSPVTSQPSTSTTSPEYFPQQVFPKVLQNRSSSCKSTSHLSTSALPSLPRCASRSFLPTFLQLDTPSRLTSVPDTCGSPSPPPYTDHSHLPIFLRHGTSPP